jgi:hypothetical protein
MTRAGSLRCLRGYLVKSYCRLLATELAKAKRADRASHQTAKLNSGISSKIRLKAGSGTLHMVLYVYRKGSQMISMAYR